MSEKRTISLEELAKLADSLELAVKTEQQAQNLCELAEKFAQKYENWLIEIKKRSPASDFVMLDLPKSVRESILSSK